LTSLLTQTDEDAVIAASIDALERLLETYRKMSPLQTAGLSLCAVMLCLLTSFYVYTLWYPKSMRDIVHENIELTAEAKRLIAIAERATGLQKSAELERDRQKERTNALSSEMEQLKASVPTAVFDNQELRKNIAAERVEKKALSEGLDRERDSAQALQKSLQSEISALKASQAAVQEKLASQSKQHAAASVQAKTAAIELETRIARLTAELRVLAKKHAELEALREQEMAETKKRGTDEIVTYYPPDSGDDPVAMHDPENPDSDSVMCLSESDECRQRALAMLCANGTERLEVTPNEGTKYYACE